MYLTMTTIVSSKVLLSLSVQRYFSCLASFVMNKLFYLVALALLLKPAWAGGIPGGYERLWIWYAYRIDQLNPPAQRTIATGCRTSSGDAIGHCYFTELMEYIDSPRTYPSWFNNPAKELLPNNPKNLSPTISVAETMNQQNRVPDRFTPNNVMGPGTGGFTGMINRIANVVRNTRTSLSASDLQTHKDLFNTADQCLHKSIGFRRKAMHFHMNGALRHPTSGVADIYVPWKGDNEFGRFLDLLNADQNPRNTNIKNVSQRLANWFGVRPSLFSLFSAGPDVAQDGTDKCRTTEQLRGRGWNCTNKFRADALWGYSGDKTGKAHCSRGLRR